MRSLVPSANCDRNGVKTPQIASKLGRRDVLTYTQFKPGRRDALPYTQFKLGRRDALPYVQFKPGRRDALPYFSPRARG